MLYSEENHEDMVVMQGTSMACPNVAGAAALILQYFRDGHYHGTPLTASANLLRAVIVTSADPLSEGDRAPNGESGFGQVNLGNYLAFPDSDFDLFVGDHIQIGQNEHLFATFHVANDQREVRVTITFSDSPLNTDSTIPLLNDLDLVVVGPHGEVFRGNHHPDESEEHYSTIERVIIPASELSVGLYEIHVLAALDPLEPTTQFAIVISGAVVADPFVSFKPATDCPGKCGAGTCGQNDHKCQCPAGYLGQNCQLEVVYIDFDDTPTNVTVQSLGLRYVAFRKPEDLVDMFVTRVTPESRDFYWQLYFVDDALPPVLPREFDGGWYKLANESYPVMEPYEAVYSKLPVGEQFYSVLLRNDSPVERVFMCEANAGGKRNEEAPPRPIVQKLPGTV
jgi:hypothetical protein